MTEPVNPFLIQPIPDDQVTETETVSFWERYKKYEPARVAEFVRLVLVALVGAGWLTSEQAEALGWPVALLIIAAFVVGSTLLTRFTRNRVTPVNKLDGGTH